MKVGIVNAGGLCPGINNVIYDLVYSLEHLYQIHDIYGIQFGYSGFLKYNMLKMNTNNVEGIQHESGSLLGTSRGTLDVEKVASRIMDHDINQLYVIGGDGTHKGAHKLCEYFEKNASDYDFSLVCIPKTIDNDLSIIDKSFGFESAVDKAKDAIINAYTEARDTEKGLGIVKVMGRNCGWIASSASLASYNVDVCLIPEYGFDFEKVANYIDFVMNTKGFCVIVIAEGVTCKEFIDGDEEDIGLFFKKHYVNNTDYCVKYIDPTYQIRALPANTSDSIYCKMLAQSAVHAAMGGYTDCTVGLVNNSMCLIPLSEIVKKKNMSLKAFGSLYYNRLYSLIYDEFTFCLISSSAHSPWYSSASDAIFFSLYSFSGGGGGDANIFLNLSLFGCIIILVRIQQVCP